MLVQPLQVFHTLYHTDENILLGAPTGSGKTIVGELALLRLFGVYPGMKAVYIAPMKALARERLLDWSRKESFGVRPAFVSKSPDGQGLKSLFVHY